MFGGRERAEERARRKSVFKHVKRHNDGGMECFDIGLLEDDVDLGDEEVQRFHFFDVDDGIGDVSFEGDSSDKNVEKRSQTSVGRI